MEALTTVFALQSSSPEALAQLMTGVTQLPFGRQSIIVLGSFHAGKTSTVQSVLLDEVAPTTSTVGILKSDLMVAGDMTTRITQVRIKVGYSYRSVDPPHFMPGPVAVDISYGV